MVNYKLMTLYITDINRLFSKKEAVEDVEAAFKEMFQLEKRFSIELKKSKKSKPLFHNLGLHIRKFESLSSSKTYFRVRYGDVIKPLNKSMDRIDVKELQRYPINYKFCSFSMRNTEPTPAMRDLYKRISDIRESIINKHLLLAIHSSKTFSNSATGADAEFEDLVQVCNEALLDAADKFVMDDTSAKFHQRAIGLMLAGMINYSQSLSPVHIHESDARMIYKIRKYMQKNSADSYKEIAEILNITEREIGELMGATSATPLDAENDDSFSLKSVLSDKKNISPEESSVRNNIQDALRKGYKELTLMEIKALRLRGVTVEESLWTK